MRDLEVGLDDGRVLTFRECLQAAFHRSPGAMLPLPIVGWWTDEASPLLVSFGPEVRFQYQHLVLDLDDGMLRLAFRRLEVAVETPDS